MSSPDDFRIVYSPDFPRLPDGRLRFGGWEGIDAPGISREVLPESPSPEIAPEQLQGADALCLYAMKVTAASLEGADRLKIVARAGVGFDNVAVEACTERGIVVTNTPHTVRRPMASAGLLAVLALAYRLPQKERITRNGEWQRFGEMAGTGLTGKTLGVIGAGNIGAEFLRLVEPLETRRIVYDPFLDSAAAAAGGFELVGLESLFEQVDYLCITAPLTDGTHHIVNAERLALMKPTAQIVNISRGPLIDEPALIEALRAGRLAGAHLDVFEQEPVDPENPLLSMENVNVTPHCLGVSDELYVRTNRSVTESLLDVIAGRVPENALNPEAMAP
jgi:phosphoglycerate dehydrogenase-like enzyme